MSIRALAEAVGMSPSMVSQIEKGTANPSVDTLASIVSTLDLSLDGLLEGRPEGETPSPAGPEATQPQSSTILRKSERSKLAIAPGVRLERLTPAEIPGFDFTLVTYETGSASCEPDALIRHRGREYGLVVEGRLGATVGFDSFELDPGDAIRLDSSMPHRVWAIGNEPCVVLWSVLERGADPRQGARQSSGG